MHIQFQNASSVCVLLGRVVTD